MSVRRLIEFFSMFTNVPVQIEDVVAHMLEMGVQDDIRLIPMDVPPEKLLGMLVRYRDKRKPYAEVRNNALIFYNENVDEKMQRLICCKELIHLFDSALATTNSLTDLCTLVDELTDASLASNPMKLSLQTMVDNIALYMALAVLFPHEMRDEWIEAHNDKRVSIADISTEFAIPTEYIPILLSKDWDAVRRLLMLIGAPEQTSQGPPSQP